MALRLNSDVSVGNLASIISMLIAVGAAYGLVSGRLKAVEDKIIDQTTLTTVRLAVMDSEREKLSVKLDAIRDRMGGIDTNLQVQTYATTDLKTQVQQLREQVRRLDVPRTDGER